MATIDLINHIYDLGMLDFSEDQLCINNLTLTFGVFDGASSVVTYTSKDGKSGGFTAAFTAANLFDTSRGELEEIAQAANKAIDQAERKAGIDTTKNVNRFGTTAAVARLNNEQAEFLVIGDSMIIVEYKNGEVVTPLPYVDQDLAIMQKWRHLADTGKKNIRKLIDDDLLKHRQNANTYYGMLNGDLAANGHIRINTLPLQDISLILIFTDGMYLPKKDPDENEQWDKYISLYREVGLGGIVEKVRALENEDPELTIYPRYKLHDDASAIALEFK